MITFRGESCILSVIRDVTERRRIEAAAARLAAIVESSEDAIIGEDLDGIVTSWNRGAEKIFRYTEKEVVGQSITRLIPPERLDEEAGILARIRLGNRVPPFDTVRLRKDGGTIDVAITVSAIKDSAGRIIGASKVARDITERKKAELELRASEQRMRLATETTAVGIWEWNVLSNQIRWDAQMFRIYGIAPTHDDFVPYTAWSAVVLPDDLPEQEAIMNDTLSRLGQSARDFRIRRADDREVRHIHAVETVRTNARGEAEWMVGTNLDITERTRAEAALRESEGKLRKVIDGLGPYMFVGLLTPDGRLIEANRPALEAAGLKPEDVLGQPFAETYWWGWSEAVQAQLSAAIARAVAGVPSRYDVQVRVADATLIWIDFSLFPVRDSAGEVIFLVPSANVIDERKRAEAAIQESEERFRTMANSIPQFAWIARGDGYIT
jgi:PAS domain S-box-containing protein